MVARIAERIVDGVLGRALWPGAPRVSGLPGWADAPLCGLRPVVLNNRRQPARPARGDRYARSGTATTGGGASRRCSTAKREPWPPGIAVVGIE